MFKIFGPICFILFFNNFECITGSKFDYIWVPLTTGANLPKNILWAYKDSSTERFIGRARHFDEILPAEIYKNGTAFISTCNKIIQKEYFEILTSSEHCEWKSYHQSDYSLIDETIVRGGTAWNGEPIYIGRARQHISGIYLTKGTIERWYSDSNYNDYYDQGYQILSCTTKSKWIDSSSMKIPNNTISGGKSEDDNEIYVARLKRNCEVVVGQVVPDLGIATGILGNGLAVESAYCQVLVGEPNEYKWVSASDGEFPDYAVVSGKQNSELSYVIRLNKTIGHLTHSEALEGNLDYEVLVVNE